ncbi:MULTISPECIES: hypothetical protein [Vibrio]|uniref:hypothetical protein n=1 Tax=Vibrio TaxID=662 RepID=UPI000C8535CD|nr:hypothetical protein [Vibrio breoganii]PMG96021.1 hypothetical protein BCU79_09040 [Vibrio breoganii]
MTNFSKTTLASFITLSLIGCGGGGGGSSDETVAQTLSGKVIDGYISGATVFLDLNFNGKLDEGEPSAVTDINGDFDLKLSGASARCSEYVPTVTLVPVGAIDSDYPDTPIEEAYTMVSPPSFAMGTNEDLLNLTPLTSIVWSSVEKELAEAGQSLSCDAIVAEQELRANISGRLEQQEHRFASRYNITVEELYGDYVESGNTELHTFAQSLVPGLQASYAETLELEASYPNADYVYVEYFLGMLDFDELYDDKWYRKEFVQASTGNWDTKTNLMTDDLLSRLAVVEQYSQRTKLTDTIEYEDNMYMTRDTNWTNENPSYNCGANESYMQRSEISYGFANQATNVTAYDVMPISSWEDCQSMDRVAYNHSQELITKVYYPGTTTPYTESHHSYVSDDPGDTSGMEHLIGLGDNLDNLDGSELNSLNYIDTSFENTDDYGSVGWRRIMNVYTGDESRQTQTVHVHTNTDSYTVYTYNPDGTHSKLCGLWSTGELADNCHPAQ